MQKSVTAKPRWRAATTVILTLVASTTLFVSSIGPAQADALGEPPRKTGGALVLFVRGSGEQFVVGPRFRAFRDNVFAALDALGLPRDYVELGDQNRDGHLDNEWNVNSGYPAVAVFPWAAYMPPSYWASVRLGVNELVDYLNRRTASCWYETIALGAYSQGAHVAEEALLDPRLSAWARNHIGYAALYGSPKRNAGCGQNRWWIHADTGCIGGLLGARDPYLPEKLKGRAGSWCDTGDAICASNPPVAAVGGGSHTWVYEGHWIQSSVSVMTSAIWLKVQELNYANPPMAAIAQPGGEQDVFWRSADGNLYEAVWNNGWHGAYSLGMGPMGSAPTAARQASGQQNVFWRGIDGKLKQAYYDADGWHGPLHFETGHMGSAPAALAYGNNVAVFWKGIDTHLWAMWWDGVRWNGPAFLGYGALNSAPAVAANVWGEQFVYWRGANCSLWEAYYAAGSWHGPINLGMGCLGSAPTVAVQPGTNNQSVFWKDPGGDLRVAWYDAASSTWNGPAPPGNGMGPLGSAPSAAAWGVEQDVFWRSADGTMREAVYNNGWRGPVIPGSFGPIPAA